MSKKLLLLHLPSADNYGTAMMGICLLHWLIAEGGRDWEYHCDFSSDDVKADFVSELRTSSVKLARFSFAPAPSGMPSALRKLRFLKRMVLADSVKGYDAVFVLGGDDFSEYYRTSILLEVLGMWFWTLRAPVVLAGQTIGPFERSVNRIACRLFLPRLHVIARDEVSLDYLRKHFRLSRRLHNGADLAFLDLPGQSDQSTWLSLASSFGLAPDGYVTVVMSALRQQEHYTTDRAAYLRTWHHIVRDLLANNALTDKKVCLLAHTFGAYGDESVMIREFCAGLSPAERARIIPITERILPTRARLVLGNSLFAVSGRMHAAVSALQMGKPAITLAYSSKFHGVIGMNMKRDDLVLDAAGDDKWSDGTLARMVKAKANYILQRQSQLGAEIRAQVLQQKQGVSSALRKVLAIIQ